MLPYSRNRLNVEIIEASECFIAWQRAGLLDELPADIGVDEIESEEEGADA